jgi:hypothetical protein
MEKTENRTSAYQLGIYGAISTIIGILLSGPLGLVVVSQLAPQPAWQNAQVFAENLHWLQSTPYFAGFFLVGGYVVMLAAMYQVAEDKDKTRALVAVVFTAAFAALIFFNYIVQTTFVPTLARDYRPEYEAIIAALSMANSKSLAWAIELWGYGFLGVATWFAAPVLRGGRLGNITAVLFVVNGVVSVMTAIWAAVDLGWVLTPLGVANYAIWNLLVLIMSILVVIVFQGRKKAALAGRSG